ncbi:MAG: thioester reductase domain-containing protein [Streptosporangiaceae bacterium]
MLLTGATGFVGAFVLAELLRQSSSVVRCLVRAEDEVHARERVTAVLRRFRLAAELDRMAAIPADLSRPLLGMTPPVFAGLAAQTDAVIHCAAGVNAALSYSHLRAANVSGTRELLRLASAGNAAAFHHISTISAGELTEDGYPLSKWAAEQLVSEAARRGLHALTYRLGRVSAASRSGVWNDADTVARIIRGSVEISAFPAFGDQADQDWTPVDALAQLIRHLVCSPRERGKIFTISGVRVQYAQILAWTRSYGYTFSLLSPAAWARRVAQDPHNPASGLSGNVLRWLAQDGTRRGGKRRRPEHRCRRDSARRGRAGVSPHARPPGG